MLLRLKWYQCRSGEVDRLKIYFGDRANRTSNGLDMGNERQRGIKNDS